MRRPLTTLLHPRWLALHALVAALSVAMVLLGRWQLHVSEGKGFSIQNLFYAFQWWVFTAFLLLFWFRVLRDHVRPPAPVEATGEVVVANAGDAAPAPGATVMVAEPTRTDEPQAPTLYRGYVMPQLSEHPDRTGDTRMRDAYNDRLWQLALADAVDGDGPRPTTPRPLVDAPTLAARAAAARDRELAARERAALEAERDR